MKMGLIFLNGSDSVTNLVNEIDHFGKSNEEFSWEYESSSKRKVQTSLEQGQLKNKGFISKTPVLKAAVLGKNFNIVDKK